MTGKEAFGVVVRATGLWIALYGLYALVITLTTQVAVGDGRLMPEVFFAYDIVVIVVGIILLRWPGGIVRFAYPRRKETLFDPAEIVDWTRAKNTRDSKSREDPEGR